MTEEHEQERHEELEERLARELRRELEAELDHPLDEEDLERVRREVKERLRRELEEKRRREREAEAARRTIRERVFVRFGLNVRAQHLVMAVGVILLIVTGLPIKFHEAGWAQFTLRAMGGLEVSRFTHRVGATMLILVGAWHMLWLMTPKGRREFWELLPRPKDVRDFWQNLKQMLGLTQERPRYGRYSYIEKFDYWAVYWGMVIMIGSGLILWFNNFALSYLPLYAVHIAREAHSDEAMLATLAIVVWHWYNAHLNPSIFPFNPTIFTGKISEERMIEEHPLEYEQLVRRERAREREAGQDRDQRPEEREREAADREPEPASEEAGG